MLKEALLRTTPKAEGGHRVFDIADSRLWYLTAEQADAFIELRNSPGSRAMVLDPEIDLLTTHAREINSLLPERFSVVDLGCGDAEQAAALLPRLKGATEYIPVDINEEFLHYASQRIEQLGIRTTPLKQDFAQLELPPGPKLILFLGNTIGNFDRFDIFGKVRENMRAGDVLAVGYCQPIERDEGPAQAAPWIQLIAEELGIARNAEFAMRKRGERYEDVFEIHDDITITHNGKELHLRRGDVIIAVIYYTFTPEQMGEKLGLRVMRSWTQHAFALTVARKI